jgi:hypothetical protein
MGHLSPLPDMVSLKKKLTAEAVAWVCISVFLDYIWLTVQILWGFKALQAGKSLGTVFFKPFLFKARWLAIIELIENRPAVLDEIAQQVIDGDVAYNNSGDPDALGEDEDH